VQSVLPAEGGRRIAIVPRGALGGPAAFPRYHRAMFNAADAPDPEDVHANYLKTCAMLGIEAVPRERALGLIGEWTEVLTGRPEPTTH
jgi:hypothetical protein